jgi:casein kinase I family protein HRR25
MNFTDGRIRNAVKRHETQMVLQNVQFFADVGELAPRNIDPNKKGCVDWRGDRGWFDQCAKIARRRGLEDSYHDWTGAENPDSNATSNDSYCGSDFSLWQNRQRERDHALTLDSRGSLDLHRDGNGVGKILEVSRTAEKGKLVFYSVF